MANRTLLMTVRAYDERKRRRVLNGIRRSVHRHPVAIRAHQAAGDFTKLRRLQAGLFFSLLPASSWRRLRKDAVTTAACYMTNCELKAARTANRSCLTPDAVCSDGIVEPADVEHQLAVVAHVVGWHGTDGPTRSDYYSTTTPRMMPHALSRCNSLGRSPL